jgi:hypothetical protein
MRPQGIICARKNFNYNCRYVELFQLKLLPFLALEIGCDNTVVLYCNNKKLFCNTKCLSHRS